jgi:hypothetical protein
LRAASTNRTAVSPIRLQSHLLRGRLQPRRFLLCVPPSACRVPMQNLHCSHQAGLLYKLARTGLAQKRDPQREAFTLATKSIAMHAGHEGVKKYAQGMITEWNSPSYASRFAQGGSAAVTPASSQPATGRSLMSSQSTSNTRRSNRGSFNGGPDQPISSAQITITEATNGNGNGNGNGSNNSAVSPKKARQSRLQKQSGSTTPAFPASPPADHATLDRK